MLEHGNYIVLRKRLCIYKLYAAVHYIVLTVSKSSMNLEK